MSQLNLNIAAVYLVFTDSWYYLGRIAENDETSLALDSTWVIGEIDMGDELKPESLKDISYFGTVVLAHELVRWAVRWPYDLPRRPEKE